MTNTTTPPNSPSLTVPANDGAAAPQAVHEPFTWLVANPKHDPSANLVALTLDVSLGIQTCLALVHSDSLTNSLNALALPGDQARLLMQPSEGNQLLRLAIASAKLLSIAAEGHIEWLNKKTSGVVE